MDRAKAVVMLGAVLTSLALTGCTNPNVTEYRVIDRFQVASTNSASGDMPKPSGRQFLWVKPWGTEKDKSVKSKDLFIDKEVWDTCWMGDKYTERMIGEDTCVRTDESVMPTSVRMEQDPEFRKRMEEKARKVAASQTQVGEK